MRPAATGPGAMTATAGSSRRAPWRARALAALAIAAVAGGLAPGCMSPERKHRILSFLFDGVPPLGGPVELAALPGQEPLEPLEPIHRPGRPPEPTLYLHGPYAQKKCGDCHEGRRSNRLLVRKQELCWKCHEQEEFDYEVLHGPVASGQCDGCHNPHRSPNPAMLVRSTAELCAGCHDQNTFPGAEAHRAEQGEDCISCHDPHGAPREHMLVKPQAAS